MKDRILAFAYAMLRRFWPLGLTISLIALAVTGGGLAKMIAALVAFGIQAAAFFAMDGGGVDGENVEPGIWLLNAGSLGILFIVCFFNLAPT